MKKVRTPILLDPRKTEAIAKLLTEAEGEEAKAHMLSYVFADWTGDCNEDPILRAGEQAVMCLAQRTDGNAVEVDVPVDLPLFFRGEVIAVRAAGLVQAIMDPRAKIEPFTDDAPVSSTKLILAREAANAEVIAWSQKSLMCAINAEVPPHDFDPVVAFGSRAQLWLFDGVYAGPQPNVAVMGALVAPTLFQAVSGEALICYLTLDTAGPRPAAMRLTVQTVRSGRFPDETEAVGGSTGLLSKTIALASWLRSPYIPTDEVRVDRGLRRAAQKQSSPNPDPRVRVVHLRKLAREEAEPGQVPEIGTDRDAVTGRKLKVRFVVSGHFRAQWYPSRKAHQVIWVPPFLKGPEDAPFQESKRVVKKVDR